MSATSYLPLVVFGVLFALYYVWMFKKRARAQAEAGPAWQRFFEHLGYKYHGLQDQPVQRQVERALATYGKARASYRDHMIRDFHGVQVHWVQAMCQNKRRGWSSSTSWSIELESPPRVLWQIAEKSLGSAGKAVKEAFSHVTRQWEPVYSERVKTGDAELDKRFRIYGQDPQAVIAVLQTPGLKDRLLENAEVDLLVSTDGVYFNDPQNKNLHAAMGGTVGMMANAFDVNKGVDLWMPVHDRIAELLVAALQASR